MARELVVVIKVDSTQARADVRAFDAQLDQVGRTSSTGTTGVQAYDKATQALGKSQTVATGAVTTYQKATAAAVTTTNLATLSMAELDAMAAGTAPVLTTVAVATDAVVVAEEAAIVTTVGLGAALGGAITLVIGFVAAIAPWVIAVGVLAEAIGWLIKRQRELDTAEAEALQKADYYTRATKEAGYAVTDLAEAEKILEAAQRHRLLMDPAIAASNYIDKLSEQARAAMQAAAEEAALTEGLAARGLVLGEQIDLERLMTTATKAGEDATKQRAAAVEQAQAAAVKALDATIAAMQRAHATGEAAGTAIAKSFAGGVNVLRDMAIATGRLQAAWVQMVNRIRQMPLEEAIGALPHTLDAGVFPQGFSTLPNVTSSLGNLRRMTQGATEAKSAIGDLAHAFAQLAQISGGASGAVVQGLGTIIGSLDLMGVASKNINDELAELGADGLPKGTAAWQTYATSAISALTALYAVQQMITGYFESRALNRQLGNTAALLGRDFGLTFTNELTAQVKKTFDDLQAAYLLRQGLAGEPLSLVGTDFTQGAEALNLSSIIDHAGGLTPQNIDAYTATFTGLFDAIHTGTLTVAQGTRVLDENWQAFVAAGTDALGFLSDDLKHVIDLNRQFGTQSKEIAAYLKGQGAAGMTAFNGIAAAAGHTAREVEDLGIIALATFSAAVAAGMSFADALKAAGPGLSTLEKAFTDLGISTDNAALKALLLQNTILQKNPTLIAGVSALAAGFAALSNMGVLNVDTFSAMQRAGMDMYTRIQGEVAKVGGSSRDALLPMQDYLHAAEAAAKAANIPLDQMTLNMIKDSKEAGIWQEAKKSAIDLQTEAMTTLIAKIDTLINRLLGIPDVTTTVTTNHVDTYTGTPPGLWSPNPLIPGFATGTYGQYLDFGAGTPVTLHGRERVMTEAEGLRATTQTPTTKSVTVQQLTVTIVADASTDKKKLAAMVTDALRTEAVLYDGIAIIADRRIAAGA